MRVQESNLVQSNTLLEEKIQIKCFDEGKISFTLSVTHHPKWHSSVPREIFAHRGFLKHSA
jgi:hypothetical protein